MAMIKTRRMITPELKATAKAVADAQQAAMEDGRPDIPTLDSPLNGNALGDGFRIDPSANGPDSRAIEAMRERALGEGDSAWLKLNMEKQAMEQQQALEGAAAGSYGAANASLSQMGMLGGASGGARERAMQNASTASLMGQAGIRRQGTVNNMNLRIADEEARANMLNSLTGQELNYSNAQNDLQKYNINNTLSAIDARNKDRLTVYGEQMKGYAADKTGAAVARSGGGGKK